MKFSECKTWRRCGFHPRGARLIFDNLTRHFLESLVPLARTKPDPSLIRPWISQIYMIYYIYILWKKYGFFYLKLKLWYRNWGLGFRVRVRMNEWNNGWEWSSRCCGGMWWEWVNEWRREIWFVYRVIFSSLVLLTLSVRLEMTSMLTWHSDKASKENWFFNRKSPKFTLNH